MNLLNNNLQQTPLENDLPAKITYHFEDPMAVPKLAEAFAGYLSCYCSTGLEPIVIVGIGTDRSTGDSLGPLVGTKLKNICRNTFHIYGTLDDPVHAVNLAEKMQKIQSDYEGAFIVAIDACLGRVSSVGMISLAQGPVKPGAGVHKNLPEVGHIHLTGIVNVGGYMEFMVLQNTRLSIVMKLAQSIANSIFYGYHKFQLNKKLK